MHISVLKATSPAETYTLSLHDALPICEGGRLAGARLGAADEVLAFECGADGPRLDRRGRDVARARDGVEHGRAEVQLVERTDHLGSFTFLVGLDLRLLPGRYFEEHPGPPAGPGGSDRGRT